MRLIFTSEEFNIKFKGINNAKTKLDWARKLSQNLNDIYWDFTDDQISELYNKYKLESKKGLNLNQIFFPTDNIRIANSRYKYFLLYLEQILMPTINNRIFSFEGYLKFKAKKALIKKNKLSTEQKYPHYDYRYNTIILYVEDMFDKTPERMEYYEYVIHQFDVDYKGREAYLEWGMYNAKRDIELLKGEVERLKTVYEHEKDRMRLSMLKRKVPQKQKTVKPDIYEVPIERLDNSENSIIEAKNIKVQKRIENLNKFDKPVWLRSEEELIQFLSLLQKKQLIDDVLFDADWKSKYLACFVDKNFDDFSTSTPIYLNWQESLNDLGYLISELNRKKLQPFIGASKYNVKLCNVFRVRGKVINANSISKAISSSRKKKSHNDRVEEIIDVIRKRKI